MTDDDSLPPFRFRNAVRSDAALLTKLSRAAFAETFGSLYREEDLAEFLATLNEEAWREQLSSDDFAVRLVEEGSEAVAFAKLGPVSLPVEPAGPAAELRQFYILEAWQRRGIARILMDWTLCEARHRGATEIYLSVWADNHRARRLYQGYGFTFVGPYAFMVGNQADEDHILRLRLGKTESKASTLRQTQGERLGGAPPPPRP